MPWPKIAVLVVAGLVTGFLVALLERASGGNSYFSQIAFLMTVGAVRFFWWKRDSADKSKGDGSSGPAK